MKQKNLIIMNIYNQRLKNKMNFKLQLDSLNKN